MGLESLQSFFGEADSHSSEPGEESQEPTNLILNRQSELEKKRYELFKEVADNIRKSERLRSKINHGVKQGADVFSLLDDSLKCISLMTGDKLFYERNIKTLQERGEDQLPSH